MEWSDEKPGRIEEVPVSLRGRRLQVVTKIVDYELAPGETYEGVWHVEGMSHEEIVATAIYFIDRDEDCLLYTSPSPRDKRQSRMPSSA